MFSAIRKKKNALAVNGDNGYPCAIPANCLYDGESQKIYFHGAQGTNPTRRADKVCFTVYGHETIRAEACAPFMQSAVGRRCSNGWPTRKSSASERPRGSSK